jgi:hypothetical protein
MATAEEYIRASDESAEFGDKAVEDIEQQALEDIDAMYNGDDRDDELWAAMGVQSDVVIDDYDEVEPDDRDLEWSLGVAGIAAASVVNFFLDNREQLLIEPAAYKEQVVGLLEISSSELLKASKRGFDVITPAKFERIRSDILSQFDFLRTMDNTELYRALVDAGGMRPPDKIINDAMGYVSRMTSYRPGSTQFKEEVAKLISTSSKRGLKSMNRRAVQQIYTESEVDGKPGRRMVWMVEGSKNTCGYCIDRAGVVMPYSRWVVEGLPGADVCLGGDLCNCFLAAI